MFPKCLKILHVSSGFEGSYNCVSGSFKEDSSAYLKKLRVCIFSKGYQRYLALGLTSSVRLYVSTCVSVLGVCPFVRLHCGCVPPSMCPFNW